MALSCHYSLFSPKKPLSSPFNLLFSSSSSSPSSSQNTPPKTSKYPWDPLNPRKPSSLHKSPSPSLQSQPKPNSQNAPFPFHPDKRHAAMERVALRLRNLGFGSPVDTHGEDLLNTEGDPFALPSDGEEKLSNLLERRWVRPDKVAEGGGGETLLPWEREDGDGFESKGEEEEGKGLRNKRRAKAPTLAELTMEDSELRRLRREGMVLWERVNVPKAGLTPEVLENIHRTWRKSELVRLKFHEALAQNMKTAHEIVEHRTGGLVIWRSGSVMVVYRGSNYSWPASKSQSLDNQKTPTMLHDGGSPFVPDVSPNNSVTEIGRHSISSTDEKAKASNTSPALVESLTEEEAEYNSLLDGLGPRFVDWWGTGLFPVDADLLPPHIPGYKTPFRFLPTGMRSCLTNAELTKLRKLARSLPCHFALGRNRNHHGLAAAIVRLWEKSIVVKIAIKRGIQNTNNKLMADEIKKLTGGTLLQRNKYYIVIYRGKDFLPTSVAAVLAEREELTKDIQDVEEKARIAPVNPTRVDAAINERQEFVKDDKIFEGKAHCGAVEEVDAGAVEGQALAGTLAEFLEAQARWGREISDHEREKMKEEAARAKAAQMVKRVEHKLDLAQAKKRRAERLLAKVEASMVPAGPSDDQETITDEERFMFRRIGLRMKPYLHLGVRGVFDGIIENMHLHWKYRELVKLISKQKTLSFVEDTAKLLEYESGGILVAIERVPKGYALIYYRGKNYQRPISLRPKNLLTKAKALKRSVAMQRHEALSQHISELERTIEKMKSEQGISEDVEGESTWNSDEEIRYSDPQFPLSEDEGSFLDSDSDEGDEDDGSDNSVYEENAA